MCFLPLATLNVVALISSWDGMGLPPPLSVCHPLDGFSALCCLRRPRPRRPPPPRKCLPHRRKKEKVRVTFSPATRGNVLEILKEHGEYVKESSMRYRNKYRKRSFFWIMIENVQ